MIGLQESFDFIGRNYLVIIATIAYINKILGNLTPLLHSIFHYLFNYNSYYVENRDNKMKIMKNIKNYYCYSYDENNNPSGFIIEKSFIPKYYMQVIRDDYIFTIFCHKDTLNSLLKDDFQKKEINLNDNYVPTEESDEEEEKTNNLVKSKEIIYIAAPPYFGDACFYERNINLNNLHEDIDFNHKQESLFKNIMEFYKTNNYCTVFLSGNPGQGKSYFSYIMAHKMGCYLSDGYNPTEPGTFLNMYYNRAKNISATKPLIIMMDEVDIIIEKVHNNKISSHKKLKTEIYDKITWNGVFDKVGYGLFPFIIVVMTSNKDKTYIDNMDPCYLRNGRVNVVENW